MGVAQAICADEERPDVYLRAIEHVEFFAPVWAFEVLEVNACAVAKDARSVVIEFHLSKTSSRSPSGGEATALPAPVPVCTVRARYVYPVYDLQIPAE